jgi:membrane protein
MDKFFHLLRLAVWHSIQHGVFGAAKASAYSSMLTVFPALIVIAWLLSATHASKSFSAEIAYVVGTVFPPGPRDTALGYFTAQTTRSLGQIVSATIIMVMAASGVMITWMGSFRVAYGIGENPWNFWHERAIAYLLVVLGFLPMMFSMMLIVFGNQIEVWLVLQSDAIAGTYILFLWKAIRWMISFVTSVTVIMLIYHWGLPRLQPWHSVLPGAILATVLWFPVTVIFGWYVTNYATYDAVYGPLGAGIALLVWLYIISIIILICAEFNALASPREADYWPS